MTKKRLLCYSDSVTATTGFGVLSKHILAALQATGEYEIEQLAINYFGDFYSREEFPYVIVPARLKNPQDPYGAQMFLDILGQRDYDNVLVINDTFVVEEIARSLNQLRIQRQAAGRKPFHLIYYFPVDCRLRPDMATMIKVADCAVPYTHFAKEEAEKLALRVSEPIYHGVDTRTFTPLPPLLRQAFRQKFLHVTDKETFVLVNVNRNSPRKDIARSILAFAEFRKQVPNSVYYIHAKLQDGVSASAITDLRICLEHLGLDITKDVIFPNKFNPAAGFPTGVINQVYNCGDAFITTHLGEGFGLTIVEAMAAGVPVIGPLNTVMPELFPAPAGRYLYPCHEQTYIDNSGYRRMGRIEDIVQAMLTCYNDWRNHAPHYTEEVQAGLAFTQKIAWSKIGDEWIRLLKAVGSQPLAARIEGEVF